MSTALPQDDPSHEPHAPPDPAQTEAVAAPAPERGSFLHSLGAEDWSPRAWLALLRDLYLTFDRRTLGFARIMVGFLVCMDLIHRSVAWSDMYSSIGVLPTQLNLQRPQAWGAFTIFNAFQTPGELRVLWVLAFINGLCLLVGYRTKVAQILAVIFVTGMNGRVLLIENGGYVVNNLLMVWTAFLPMGDRFSVDAMLASMKRRREATAAELNDRADLIPPEKQGLHVSALGIVLLCQLAAIYYFNVIHKTGPAWRNGTAVHYVLYVDRMATPIVSLLRDRIPNFAILFMTKATMICEATIPVVLLSPVGRVWARRLAVVMINTLHLAFGITFVLGPFAWSCCAFSTLLFSSDDWEIAARTMRRAHRARVVAFDPRSGGAVLACRILKRIDHFELLTFEAMEGVPLGLGVRDPHKPGALLSHAVALADVVAALPLGPTIAWIPRLPGVREIVGGVLGGLEGRDVSGFFGLRVGPSHDAAPASPAEPVRVPYGVVIVSLVAVAGAVALALKIDAPSPGIALIVVTAVVAAVVSTAVVVPVVTTAVLRRAAVVAVRELMIVAMLAGAVNQALVELWCVNRRVKVPQPEPLRLLSHKIRLLQGWFMFSPNPVMDDGTIVVDAVTVDGRHVDPFTGKEPFWDLSAKSLGLSQIWCDYFNRIQLPANSAYREAMKEYMYRLPQRTGRPEDAIVSGEVFWVKDMNPRWNETRSYGYERAKLFSFENAANQPRPAPPPAGGSQGPG
jgi:hypothetical protein